MEKIKKFLDTLHIDNDPLFANKVKITGRLTVSVIEETPTHALIQIDGLELIGEAFWIEKAEYEKFAGAKISKTDPQKIIRYIIAFFVQIIRKTIPNDA